MAKLTKSNWLKEVIDYLNTRKDKRARVLLEDYDKLEKIAKQKRESAGHRKLMNSIQQKETVKVDKKVKDKALQMLSEVQKLLQ